MTHQTLALKSDLNLTASGISVTENAKTEKYILDSLPEILMLSSYPPRQCGIATYSQDLVKALENKFSHSFNLSICALENAAEQHTYPVEVKYKLNTEEPESFTKLAASILAKPSIEMLVIQHEFGFYVNHEQQLRTFMAEVNKPVLLVFHTVLPRPTPFVKLNVVGLSEKAAGIVVMTNHSRDILLAEYSIPPEKISVIPHGTHLVLQADTNLLKSQYNLTGKKVLSTFGLLGSGKSIETTLDALPAVVEQHPDVVFLVIGKTHPSIVKEEGERYRTMLEAKVTALQLDKHVRFVNAFLPLHELIDYLQLTDIYLFTSKDPSQAVSGTFSYAISCGCPVISTPIPHAKEVLKEEGGVIFDFENAAQLSVAINGLLRDDERRARISMKGLQAMASTAWENSAIAHALLFEQFCTGKVKLRYSIPAINLLHIQKLTTLFGMIQFSVISEPDISSGYTLDDNARALIAMCQHYELTRDQSDLQLIRTYFNFIKYCLQPDGHFLNYVKKQRQFTQQNNQVNLADANGRAVWALGYLLSLQHILPKLIVEQAESMMPEILQHAGRVHSTRAMAFVIKGLYYRNLSRTYPGDMAIIKSLSNRLVQMYRHESGTDWLWYESYLTYANSIIPEALLCAWQVTGDVVYRDIAKTSFDFLLTKIIDGQNINVVSNKDWLHQGNKDSKALPGGEQPIDVAYTIIALKKFAEQFDDNSYEEKMMIAFNWFMGNNHLHQIIYNPCTGGCYDGLEEYNVNLNQGAESTVSYLMARLTLEKSFRTHDDEKTLSENVNVLEDFNVVTMCE